MTTATTQATSIVIQNVRLSFIWAEVLPDFLKRNVPAGSPFEPFTRDYLFEQMFESARNGASTNPRVEVPWIRDRQQRFWMKYLVQGQLNEVTGSQAWKYLVPLRMDIGFRPKADWFKGDAFIDAFYYPFGTAVSISFRWEPKGSLDDLVLDAYAVYKGKFSALGSAQELTLANLADLALNTLREHALGKKSTGELRSMEPLSTFTVIQAKGVDPTANVRENTVILNALEALTSWPANPQVIKLPDLKRACLETLGHSPGGSALYAERRGRAAWIPSLFSVEQARRRTNATEKVRLSSKLGCYHRNLLFASMQAESLGRLIAYTSQLFAQGKQKANLTGNHRDLARYAAIQLAKLYRGDKGNTWRSESAQRQIEENGFQDLQTVLAEFGESPLPSTVPAGASTAPVSTAGSTASAAPPK